MKNKTFIIFLVIVLAVGIVGALAYFLQFQPTEIEPLSYSLNDESVVVSKKTSAFEYTAQDLGGRAAECGSTHDAGYFENLVSLFQGTTKQIYSFTYNAPSQEPNTLVVTILPNKPAYASLNEFKKDFDICAAGGQDYPQMLNANWLLFESSCGSGFDDGSGRPNGCEEARKAVEASLELK